MNAITVKDLTLKRGNFKLGPLSFSIEQGELIALLGQTGAGKTLLLETLAGFYANYYHGDIHIFGENAKHLPIDRHRMGFVYQDCGLFPHMTVEKNIAYGLKMHRFSAGQIAQKIDKMTELLSIDHIRKQYPATISGGERQRTALARSLVLNPDILLLDEPFTALDPATRQKIHEQIRCIHETLGCTILFVTHDFNEAQQLAQRIGIMLDGRIRAFIEADALFKTEYDAEVTAFLKG